MKLLRDVEGDEVSLVNRAANRRKFLLLKGDNGMDSDLSEILEVPWQSEGALLDEIRKDGIDDENVEKAVIAAVRLLKGVEGDFSPELIEKLGSALYPRTNFPLNMAPGTGTGGGLVGSGGADEGDPVEGSGSSGGNPGSGSGTDLEGSSSGTKVAADMDADCDDDIMKRDVSSGERKNLASEGKALPDGSFPISNKSDLGNAIKLAGKAKNPGRARAFIARRARALGATNMLPDTWSVSKADFLEDSSLEKEDVFTVDDERGTVETHEVPVQKEDGSWDFTDVPDASAAFFRAMIQKQDEQAAELKTAKEAVEKADDTLLSRTMVEKAARLSHVAATDDLAPILKEASQKLDAETFEKLETILSAAQERISKGGLFQELGRSGLGAAENKKDADAVLVEKANELVEKGDGLTFEAAYDRVIRANPDLYNQYLTEHGMGAQ